MIKRVHHIAIAVNSLEESVPVYEKVLGVKAHITPVPGQKVNEALFQVGDGTAINLVEPTGPDSAIAKYLGKYGEGLHHFALETDAVDAELKGMEDKGIQLIDREGREGAAGQIGFMHPKSLHGVLVELVEPRQE
jgi:methylmalonyl-CoA/ethylmalonyl-CoA epimerase